MKKQRSGIVDCLHKTEQAHSSGHPGGRRTDSDWSMWYASYLLNQANLGQYTSRHWKQEDLAEALTQLDAAYLNGSQNQSWAVYTAARLSL